VNLQESSRIAPPFEPSRKLWVQTESWGSEREVADQNQVPIFARVIQFELAAERIPWVYASSISFWVGSLHPVCPLNPGLELPG
jgi:hypothetical protein